jgi:hypothetical protein
LAYPVLAVLFWLSCSGFPVLAVLSYPGKRQGAGSYERVNKELECTSVKIRSAKTRGQKREIYGPQPQKERNGCHLGWEGEDVLSKKIERKIRGHERGEGKRGRK